MSGNVGIFINGTLVFYDSTLTNTNSSTDLTTMGEIRIYENMLKY